MSNYLFLIPNKKQLTYQLFAYGVLLFNLLFFFLNQPEITLWGLLSAIVLGLLIGTFDLYIYRKKQTLIHLGILLLIPSILWIYTGQYLLFFLTLILCGLYHIARRNLKIIVSNNWVQYPSFPPKQFNWKEISNLILKDDILTIDLKNNKIYQHRIEYIDKPVNEVEFNDFCSKRLDAS